MARGVKYKNWIASWCVKRLRVTLRMRPHFESGKQLRKHVEVRVGI